MDCLTIRTETQTQYDEGVRAWLAAALHPFQVDLSYFDELGEALDRSAPTGDP